MATPTEIFAAARPAIFEGLGAAAVFTPAAGDTVSLNVILRQNLELAPTGFDAQAGEIVDSIRYNYDDIGREVVVGETFLIGAVTHTVKFIIENDLKKVLVAVK